MCRDGDVHRSDAVGPNGDVAGHCGQGASCSGDLGGHGGEAIGITVEAHDGGAIRCHTYSGGSPNA